MNVLQEACRISCESWVASLDFSDAEVVFSKSFTKNMSKLLDKMRGDKYHNFTRKTVKFIAIAAIILSLTITAFAIPSSRNFIIKKFSEYSSYNIADNGDSKKVEELAVGYVPPGYELSEKFESNDSYVYTYTNSDGTLHISKEILSTEVNFDTEESDYKTMELNGIKYVIYYPDENYTGVIWNNSEYIFSVDGSLDEDEIMRVAKTVE